MVGSRVTLSLTPFLNIPPAHLMVVGCQVEPVGEPERVLLWEREQPLVLLRDGCPADDVGLVCPPERTDFGIRINTEAFRYQSTSQIQYTCLVRVCPYGVCPQRHCDAVDGCPPVVRRIAQRRLLRRSRRQSGLIQANPHHPLFTYLVAVSCCKIDIDSGIKQSNCVLRTHRVEPIGDGGRNAATQPLANSQSANGA